MYRMIAKVVLVCGIVGGAGSAMAAPSEAWTFKVNDHVISTEALSPYRTADGIVMVPLRPAAEGLGYKVHWDAKQQKTLVDAPYQIVSLKENTNVMKIANDFKVINLSGEFPLDSKIVKKSGTLYVPATLFQQLFNTVDIGEHSIRITVNKSSVSNTTELSGGNVPSSSVSQVTSSTGNK